MDAGPHFFRCNMRVKRLVSRLHATKVTGVNPVMNVSMKDLEYILIVIHPAVVRRSY